MPNAVQKIDIAERQARVAEARLEGYRSTREIAARLKAKYGIEVHHSTIALDIKKIAEDLDANTRETAERERDLSLARNADLIKRLYAELDKLDRAEADGAEPWEVASKLPIIRQLRELDESRRKILGIDAPAKHARTDPTGTREAYTGIPQSFKDKYLRPAEDAEVIDAEIVEEIS